MEEWAWEELTAQVEDHGVSALALMYEDANGFDPVELKVVDVKYEDGKIIVRLEQ